MDVTTVTKNAAIDTYTRAGTVDIPWRYCAVSRTNLGELVDAYHERRQMGF